MTEEHPVGVEKVSIGCDSAFCIAANSTTKFGLQFALYVLSTAKGPPGLDTGFPVFK